VADLSTDGSANTAAIQVLDGQTCIDELLTDIDGMFGMASPEWALPASDANGSEGRQLRLF
jgi:hypothetical protein